MNQSKEPYIKHSHSLSELSEVLSTAGISDESIQILLKKTKSEETIVAVLKNKVLIGFTTTQINREGKIESKITSLSIARVKYD